MWWDMHNDSRYVMEQPVMLSMALTRCHLKLFMQLHMVSNHMGKMVIWHFVMLCSMKQDAEPYSIYSWQLCCLADSSCNFTESWLPLPTSAVKSSLHRHRMLMLDALTLLKCCAIQMLCRSYMCQWLEVSLSACAHSNCLNGPELTCRAETDAPQQLIRLCTLSCRLWWLLIYPLFFTVDRKRVLGHVCHLIATGVVDIEGMFAAWETLFVDPVCHLPHMKIVR